MKYVLLRPLPFAAALLLLGMALPSPATNFYYQINLASDVPGLAANLDTNLKNPWGMSFSATSPFWASDQQTKVATLYNGQGTPQALVVSIPTTATGPQGPTGQVFANIAGSFTVGASPALFIFDTLSGTIDGWNGGSAATQVASKTGAVYTGLALGSVGANNFLYAANFGGTGGIDVYNSTFALASVSGTFTDPTIPAGYAPYNIQLVGANLYVEYAQQGVGGAQPGAGKGFVRVFDTNGNLVPGAPSISGGNLNAPWGVTLAPSTFGPFANDLLVGNFGDGKINVYDPVTGILLGQITGSNGQPLVNSGLWALKVRTGGGFDTNSVYITAGINGEADGLFAEISPAPEPGTIALGTLGLLAMVWFSRRRARA
jgi:uncharacterized protein (TIGR03118 family)